MIPQLHTFSAHRCNSYISTSCHHPLLGSVTPTLTKYKQIFTIPFTIALMQVSNPPKRISWTSCIISPPPSHFMLTMVVPLGYQGGVLQILWLSESQNMVAAIEILGRYRDTRTPPTPHTPTHIDRHCCNTWICWIDWWRTWIMMIGWVDGG